MPVNTKTKFYHFMQDNNLRTIDIRNATMGNGETIGYQTIQDFRHGYGTIPRGTTLVKIAKAISKLIGREIELGELV